MIRHGLIIIFLCLFTSSTGLFGSTQTYLRELEAFSEKVESDQLLISRKGRIIFCNQGSGQDLEAKQMTKTFVVLAALFAIQDGVLPWILPVEKLLRSPNDQDMAEAVTTIQKATGKRLENYLEQKLFLPLNIHTVRWRISASTPLPNLILSPEDLLKVGNLILNHGLYKTKQLLSPQLIELMLQPNPSGSPFCGLQWQLDLYDVACWWDDSLLNQYLQGGLPFSIIERLASLGGRVIHCSGAYFNSYCLKFMPSDLIEAFGSEEGALFFLEQISSQGLPLARCQAGKTKAFCSIGEGGQQLLLFPQYGIVALHQRQAQRRFKSFPHETHEFAHLVEALGQAYNAID